LIKYLKIITITVPLIISLLTPGAAQQPREESELFYTYLGPVVTGGFNFIKYKHWSQTQNEMTTDNVKGSLFSTGAVFNIYVNNLIGDFSIQYMLNFNENFPVYHMFYTAAGKYMYRINDTFSATAGLGFFFESPPSNRDYNGSTGGMLPLGIIINTSFDTKLIFDFVTNYGFFGLGEDSTRLFFTINAGFLFKVGRI